MSEQFASGVHAVEVMKEAGISDLFTLSGAHIFPLYDGARQHDVALWDFRHEQTAVFAAEGLAKLTRTPQVAAVTAGPGVTNAVSAVASASFGGSPLVLIGGRAPMMTWGRGSLQEIDHVAFMGPLTKDSWTVTAPDEIAPATSRALSLAHSGHRGPVFFDIPMDVIFTPAPRPDIADPFADAKSATHNPDDVAAIAAALSTAKRPVLVGGTDVWLDGAVAEFTHLALKTGAAVIQNGMGRGVMPARHDQVVMRARGAALKDADLVVVIGTPLDFRLGFGNFAAATVVHIADTPEQLSRHANPALTAAGSLAPLLGELTEAVAGPTGELAEARRASLDAVRDVEARKRREDSEIMTGDNDAPMHPGRVYGSLRDVLGDDTVVIGDGGDFVSFAGRYVDSQLPGRWLDPGPYGCLGTSMGYAAAARIAHPDLPVVAMVGDGAAGFSLMDVESLVRQNLPVVIVVGNNGIWALEKFPMQQMYDGWHVAAELQPELAYEQVVTAMNGAGEVVRRPAELNDAITRGVNAGVPYLVNVMTDPEVAYPRSTMLM